jgi:hypothetical protein
MYQLVKPKFQNQEPRSVKRLSDNAFIPFDDANTDFAEYKKWLAEGNVPTPADQPTE